MTRDAFTSAELTRAIAVARVEALHEAAQIAEQDWTPGYGQRTPKIADTIEWIAAKQRSDIAERIRFAALSADEVER